MAKPLPASDAGVVTACDPALYEQIVQPWKLINTPLERGGFGYCMCYLKTAAVTIYREQFDRCCRVRGLSPAETFTFSVPVSLGSRSSYWNSPLQQSGFPAMLPGALDVTIAPGQIQILILLDPSLLHDHLPPEMIMQLQLAAENHLLPAAQDDVIRLGRWLLELIEEAIRRPQMLQNSAAVRSMEQDLLQHLAAAVQLPLKKRSLPAISKRRRGVETALDYLRDTDCIEMTAPQLREASGVSMRTLEYGFRDIFDLTPADFLRMQRFHAARRKLMNAESGSTTVASIAHETGFYHLGRFSGCYQKLFHELPSRTLLRSYREQGEEVSPLI
jgi:AraC-like DNA-binding protein